MKWYDAEVSAGISNIAQAEEACNATFDVLIKTHPDLAESLDQLSFASRVVGSSETWRNDIARMRTDFIAALPYAIRMELQKGAVTLVSS